MKPEIIIALDTPSIIKTQELVSMLKTETKYFKVGMELFYSAGPEILQQLSKMGLKVFLDLKFHDIPNTVAGAARVATNYGVFMFNVHCGGGYKMMMKVRQEAEEEAAKMGVERPLIIGVTILTSMAEEDMVELSVNKKIQDQVLHLAKLAKKAGLDGVVASPQETDLIKEELGSEFLLVTPGVRPQWATKNDQQRITTPAQAQQFGSDYLVIGRPVTGAEDPLEAIKRIKKELK